MAKKKRLIKKERKSWYQRLTSWTLRLLVVLVVLTVLAVGMLSLLAGTGDMQRRGLQQAMSQITGMKAEIGNLATLKIGPKIVVEVRDVTFKPVLGVEPVEKAGKGKSQAKEEAVRDATQAQSRQQRLVTGPVKASIGRARVELSGWHLLIGSGVFSRFDLEDLHMDAGLLGGGALKLKSGAIKPAGARDNADNPAWAFDGSYAGQPLSGAIGLQQDRPGSKGVPASYYLGSTIPLDLILGDYTLNSVLESAEKGSGLRDIVLKHRKNRIANGTLSWRNIEEGKGELYRGDLDFGKSRVTGEVTSKQQDGQARLDGTITFPELHMQDLGSKPGSLTRFAGFIAETFAKDTESAKPQPIDLGGTPLEIDITIARLMTGKRTIGHIKLPIRLQNKSLRIAPISGKIAGGRLTGDIALNSSERHAKLALKAHVNDSNYTALQKAASGKAQVRGHANLDIDLTSQGKTWPALKRNLNGHITLLAGRGALASSTLNIWGGGLMNAMIPDFSKNRTRRLNCAVGHFEFNNSLATAAPLFLDTSEVTISGAGTINLRKKDALNLVLTPNAKQTAPFDVATAVNVSGPLDNPYITPDMASAAGKVGGLLLGTVNPAFLAFSMTDFGLTKQNPCKPFLVGDGSGKALQSMPAPGDNQQPPEDEQEETLTPAEDQQQSSQQTGQTPN